MRKETVLRTLNLSNDYLPIVDQMTDYKKTRSLVIEKFVDLKTKIKNPIPNGKPKMVSPEPVWSHEIVETITDEFSHNTILPTSGRYVPNLFAERQEMPKVYTDPSNPLLTLKDFQPKSATSNWIGYNSQELVIGAGGLGTIIEKMQLGFSNNEIRKVPTYKNGVHGYENPTDYKGAVIKGTDRDNQGATPNRLEIAPEDALLTIQLRVRTLDSTGKTYSKTSNSYILVSEALELLGMTQDELEHELRTETFCMELNPDTHITSVSTEIIEEGNKLKGIVYYNGEDASIKPPKGKITSYNKAYPNHVVRWMFKPSDAIGAGARGETVSVKFASNADNHIFLVKGEVAGWNAATRTFTYDREGEIWFEMEEAQAQGKNYSRATRKKVS